MSFLSTYGLVRGPSTPVFESPIPVRKPDSTPNSAKNKPESKESRVKVVVRSRPILADENGEKCESIIDLNEPEGQVIVALEKTFAFDSCFSSDVTQQDIYTVCYFCLSINFLRVLYFFCRVLLCIRVSRD